MLLPENDIWVRGVTRRLHNRRISMIVTPAGEYQIHTKRVLSRAEVAEMKAQGHIDQVHDQIIGGRIWYSVSVYTAEALDAIGALRKQLDKQRQRKRA
ncbi:hypothetical protein LJ737_04145 [Hymenobacter sp. 15J16-1T3B]|uniref:hypothetical protein n=1 Tax=Hymenobacter sp. 15J16-1T3B TaxID=2886941 RepID=UPI001D1090A6|nr:hypothetical protein [Hymenobacter sp. 15J16-1T3B]MCC3156413.1 hypothetical protein [Hymenobacter sp. 15J16-1T3B]